jgi:hypothetical protein
MSAQNVTQQVRWQDLKTRSEMDIVLEIAQKQGWKDCGIFGHGAMLTQPREIKGWTLVPADQYKYSIPKEAVARLHQVINAGVRVQGVIIADDIRRTEPAPAPVPAPKPVPVPAPALVPVPVPAATPRPAPTPARPVVPQPVIGRAVLALGRLVLGIVCFGVIGGLIAYALMHPWLLVPLGFIALVVGGSGTSRSLSTSTGTRIRPAIKYDPKLVALVDDGAGGTAWVSLFTWYD